jgi:hypothetical protein
LSPQRWPSMAAGRCSHINMQQSLGLPAQRPAAIGQINLTFTLLTWLVSYARSFASLLSPSASGPPRFFVSHRRGAPFAELADAVAQRVATMQQQQQQPATATGGYHSQPQQGAGNGNRSTSSLPGGQPLVWVDVLCMPQPTASGQQAWTQVGQGGPYWIHGMRYRVTDDLQISDPSDQVVYGTPSRIICSHRKRQQPNNCMSPCLPSCLPAGA